MKTLKPSCQNYLVVIFAGFILLTLTCCEHSLQDESTPGDPFFCEGTIQWNLTSNIIIVQKGVPCFTNSQTLMAAVWSNESGWHFFGDKLYDMGACGCEEEDVSFDDHLSVISVPILYPGARDGSDNTGDYTSSLMARTNLTYYLVLVSGTDPAYDYGHADVRFEYNADKT